MKPTIQNRQLRKYNVKLLLLIIIFFFPGLLQTGTLSAQTSASDQFVKDSTPIELLDYHLSKDQFIYYYGKDDTAKAIINMFYRKRGSGAVDFALVPVLSFVGGTVLAFAGIFDAIGEMSSPATTLITAGLVVYAIGIVAIPVFFIIRRSIYTRQKLIYVLVRRERGKGITDYVKDNLRNVDFW